jgi:hypothetical protein
MIWALRPTAAAVLWLTGRSVLVSRQAWRLYGAPRLAAAPSGQLTQTRQRFNG